MKRTVAFARALAASLPAAALLAIGGTALAQVPRSVTGATGTSGLGGFDTFGVHGDPLEPDPLARGSGLDAFVDASERATISNRTELYGDIGVGGTAFVNRDRVEASAMARFSLRQPEIGQGNKTRFLTSGLGRGAFDLIRNRLVLDLTGYADVIPRSQANGTTLNPIDQNGNLAQIYLVSAQPRFRREIGALAILNADYRASYVSVTGINGAGGNSLSNGSIGGALGGGVGGIGGGQQNGPTFQPLSDTFTQAANVSVSNQPRDGRFIISLSGNVSEEQQQRLEQRFRSQGGAVDITYALSRPVALLGNVGYEDYKSSEQAIAFTTRYLADPLTGRLTQDPNTPNLLQTDIFGGTPTNVTLSGAYAFGPNPMTLLPLRPGQNYIINPPTTPVGTTISLTDPNLVSTFFPVRGGAIFAPVVVSRLPTIGDNGDFMADKSGLRQTTYAQKGLVWNVGFRYAPSRRNLIELRVGQRFADVTVTGSIRQEFRNGLTIVGSLTDGIETFSSIVTDTVKNVSTSFVGRGAADFGGCLQHNSAGGCSDSQSVTSGVFRSRYGTLGASIARGLTDYRIAYLYDYRRYLDTGATIIADPTFAHRSDTIQRFYVAVGHRLNGRQRFEATAFVGQNDLGLTRTPKDTYAGVGLSYQLKLNERFDAFADVAASERISGTIRNNLYGTLAFGARYHF